MNSAVLSDDFEKVKDSSFVLYGASGSGTLCYNYLKDLGLADNIICFADSNPQKHGRQHCGKDIRAVDFIRKHPELIIIISSSLYCSVYKSIRDAGCVNPVYAYVLAEPPYAVEEEFISDITHISSYYNPLDEYTKIIIEALILFRDPANANLRIQPIDNVMCLSMFASYWYDDYTTLNVYDGLTICDMGAFDGDTLKQLFEDYGDRIKKYYAFEPNNLAFSKLIETISSFGATRDRIYPLPFGIGEKNESLRFCTEGPGEGGSHFDEDGNIEVIIKRLDDLDIEVEGKLCIKMDIEGFEMEALRGARGLIEKHKPNLAICVYHKPNDVFLISEYIKSINPEYNCVIRGGTNMVCYACCDK
jgi:FkbM family methyltransferase